MSDYNNQNYTDPEGHQPEREEHRANKPSSLMAVIFGIIMVIVYVGMGTLLLINFFGWDAEWNWSRYGVGILLIIYGFWRAYRQIKGID